jgi:nicotinate dehydrogenase subunit B
MNSPKLPASLAANPRLDRWVRFDADRRVTVFSGKVEIGQGIATAIAQIAAEELEVSLQQLTIVSGDTTRTPNEGVTSGSMSIEQGGRAMRAVCAEVRHLFVEAAAIKLEVRREDLVVRDGEIFVPGTDVRTSYWELAAEVSLAREASGSIAAKPAQARTVIGTSVPRLDLAAKFTGAAFIHDIELPDMLHARVLRPPSYSARLVSLDADKVRALPGVVAIVVDGSFVGVCAEREEQAVKALDAARAAARWKDQASLPESREIRELLPLLKSERVQIDSANAAAAPVAKRLAASYSRPYIAHASIGPSCAAAHYTDGELTVWSHSQGVFFLRGHLARALGMPIESIAVIHRDGAGCYGHNGADDVALDAALLARACGRPVLVQWTREDELACSPCGAAMLVQLAGGLDASGRIVEWQHDVWSQPHSTRPTPREGVNLLAAWHLATPHAPSTPVDVPMQFGGGGGRNSIPLYVLPNRQIALHVVQEPVLRVSALRALGGYANVFAIESFMDELAAAAGVDPVAFRLAHLEDPRARAVIETAARASGWIAGATSDGRHGRGIGFARYKNAAAYCAVVMEIEVAEQVKLKRCVAAVDAGEIINPDGLRNQIEGGIVQAASWTLKEALRWDTNGVRTRSWEDYPILGFSEVPEIDVILIDHPELRPLGAGECAAGPTAAAIANALQHALGVRARHLPLTPERIAQAMER